MDLLLSLVSTLLMGLIGCFILIITLYVLKNRKRTPSNIFFILTTVSATIWSLGYAAQIFTTTFQMGLEFTLIAYKLLTLGNFFIAPSWLLFEIYWSQGKQSQEYETVNPFKQRLPIILFSITAILCVPLLTLELHDLFLIDPFLIENTPIIALGFTPGPLYWIGLIYIYSMLSLSMTYFFYLERKFSQEKNVLFQKQVQIMLIGSLFPIFFKFIDLVRIFEFSDFFDFSPIGLFIAFIFFTYSLAKYDFLDIIPFAREYILTNFIEGFIVIDSNFEVVDINEHARDIFFDKEEGPLIGRNLFQALEITDHITSGNLIKQKIIDTIDVMKRQDLSVNEFTIEINIPTKMRRSWLLVGIRKMINQPGNQLLGFIIFLSDITDKEYTKMVSAQSESMKDIFIAMLSHDLLSGIGVIRGFTEIAEIAEDPSEKSGALTKVIERTQKIEESINSVLNFIEVSNTALTSELTPYRLVETIDSELKALNDKIESKKIIINFDYTSKQQNEINIAANIAIKSVFHNILTNAIKFSSEGKTIRIQLEKIVDKSKEDFIIVKICDQGPGVPNDLKTEVFKPFKKFGKEAGTGLGLAVSKEAIEIFGGKIWITDNHPHGTIMNLKFPIYQ